MYSLHGFDDPYCDPVSAARWVVCQPVHRCSFCQFGPIWFSLPVDVGVDIGRTVGDDALAPLSSDADRVAT
jgi:hypothetical protein